jgi:hypothetical protein
MTNAPSRGHRSRIVSVAAGFAMLLLAAGGAYASIAALTTSETITACKSRTGDIRIVDDAMSCRNQEVSISWNTEGPPGPAGPAGPPGPPGPPGTGGLSKLEYVTAGPDTGPQQAVEAVCGPDLHVVGGAVRNRPIPGTLRASHPSNGTGSGQAGSRGWFGVVVGGNGPFSVYAICAPAGATEFRSAGGQYSGQYGG